MSSANKLAKTMELLEKLQKLYPNLHHVTTDNLEEPKFLMICDDS